MKRIFVFIFGLTTLLFPHRGQAQLMDDLFDEDDFKSSEIQKMRAEEAERQKQNAPVATTTTPATASTPVPAKTPAAATAPKPAATAAGRTFTAPKPAAPAANASKAAQPAMPQLGSGKSSNMPALGKRRGKDDDNLSLFEMRSRKTGSGNANVMSFDIAGVMLKMNPEEAISHAVEAGFVLKGQDYQIPDLNKWRYRRTCLKNRLFAFRSRENCVREIAREDEKEYISRLMFENKERREKLTVEFSSNFSDNQAYRITYVSKGDHSLGTTDEARYFKSKRRAEFLRLLVTKYGAPDDEQALEWGMSGLGATLQAEISDSFLDASLVLEDTSVEDKDVDAIIADEAKQPSTERFGF